MEAQEIVELLGMLPHPEGGYYKETFRAPAEKEGERGACTAIYFLLAEGQKSHWHKVDAVETWLWHSGAPLELSISEDAETVSATVLGADLKAGQRPQGVVPKDAWQAARSLGKWTLVSCTVAPAFEFSGFTLAPPGWAPGKPLA
ncbi:cupin superfamily protein [Acanthamoeba castellanii str. Neff]|uniref:Cupin superfamily protein n=1 Tax=Acanthamoeba castellanii (strain ATCC 30010 / Neff) TaxID=1257118 RepID=L8HLG4_ACACF|nr:cupin superfamily protein [Acanthamoeba castellanii str. Neff]ELR25236.1 cupin superfamily protein [Acanthamoeba castellanii str. Neff]